MPLRIPEFFLDEPGVAINAAPFEAETFIDFTGPPGSMTGLIYSVYFQLGKWGFQTHKVDEWIDVSPVFKQYYDITIQQRQALESQIKAGLAQIANSIHDYELVAHDLRKYKEFLDYFTKVEKGKEFIKLKKAAEEGKRILKEGDQTLKAVFIDEVDVHTGEGIALKLIAPRWPTIIADFMRIEDEDTDPEKISKKLKVSEAEGVVLATKNKLYVEWRDKLFKPTILDRYQRISRLTEARKASIKEYSNMLRPVITRFRLISDALEEKERRELARGHPLMRTDAQAYSMDFIRMWAWRPFSPTEKYKMTREIEMTEIPATKAGFSREEVKYLVSMIKKKSDTKNLTLDEELMLKSQVQALPVDGGGSNGYSIDKIVRRYAGLIPGFKGPTIPREYGVTIDIRDVFEARTRLSSEFSRRVSAQDYSETGLRQTSTGKGVKRGSPWVFSPYFVFLDVPLLRGVFKLPNGAEMEDLEMENLRTATKSQNVIIIHLLEVIAREKQLENYIGTLLGEVEGEKFQSIEDLSKDQYPEVYGKLEKLKYPTEGGLTAALKKIRASFGDVLRAFGLTSDFVDWTRARGPYEFALDDRITEVIQPDPGGLYKLIVSYMQQAAGVPGVKW